GTFRRCFRGNVPQSREGDRQGHLVGLRRASILQLAPPVPLGLFPLVFLQADRGVQGVTAPRPEFTPACRILQRLDQESFADLTLVRRIAPTRQEIHPFDFQVRQRPVVSRERTQDVLDQRQFQGVLLVLGDLLLLPDLLRLLV